MAEDEMADCHVTARQRGKTVLCTMVEEVQLTSYIRELPEKLRLMGHDPKEIKVKVRRLIYVPLKKVK